MLALQSTISLPPTLSSVWPHLDEKKVMSRLEVLMKNPDLINQASLGVCGEAAFFHHVLQRRPIAFFSMAKLLFMDGWGFIGDVAIHPDDDLINADYAAIVAAHPNDTLPPQADWMVMSALCDTGNLIFDFEGQPDEDYADGTYFSQMFRWYRDCGLYKEVKEHDDDDIADIKVNLVKSANSHIMLFINTVMIKVGKTGRHFITLETPLVIDEANDSVSFWYWTWGDPPAQANMTIAHFTANYLSAVIAKF